MHAFNDIQFALQADTFHAPVKGQFAFHPDFLLLINTDGDIAATYTSDHPHYADVRQALVAQDKLKVLEKGQYLMPGLVDLHCHAPQWPQAGKGLDLPLYDWLQNYTFPLENRYQDLAFAAQIYQDVTRTLLANGTTSAVYFASIDRAATELLAQQCMDIGQRAYVGKINMDNTEQCPPYYCEQNITAALDDTDTFIHNVLAMKGNENRLVQPVITRALCQAVRRTCSTNWANVFSSTICTCKPTVRKVTGRVIMPSSTMAKPTCRSTPMRAC